MDDPRYLIVAALMLLAVGAVKAWMDRALVLLLMCCAAFLAVVAWGWPRR